MPSREEIREGTREWLIEMDTCHNEDCGDAKCDSSCPYLNKIVDKFLVYLHSQGVVIKIDRELPDLVIDPQTNRLRVPVDVMNEMLKAGYTAWKPLVEKEVSNG